MITTNLAMKLITMYSGLVFLFCLPWISGCQTSNELIVCGDNQVIVFDVDQSQDTLPHITWRWEADKADLPEKYRLQYFQSIDECKPVAEGSQLLITSSSGGVVLVDKISKNVLFYAFVGNAHSAELLPHNRIIVAASTHDQGNRIELFDINQSESPIFQDSLYSGHGVVWDQENELLYALGYDQLRAYQLKNWNSATPSLERLHTWEIPGESGHDLAPLPHDNSKLLLTVHEGVWLFDKERHTFEPFEPLESKVDIKSVSFHATTDQMAYIQAETSWWAHRVYLKDTGQWFSFPKVKLYKVRWMPEAGKQ